MWIDNFTPSMCHQAWRCAYPECFHALASDDAYHLQMMAAGWSWVDVAGGPRDGARYYYVGPPLFRVLLPDVEGCEFHHVYQLHPHVSGQMVYLYQESTP